MLFGGYDMETAFKHIAMAGYDGIELSAIDGMSQHLVLANWQELAGEIKRFAKDYELELLAMEQPSRDPERMELAFQAAAEIGVPIINCGPGGASDDESAWPEVVDSLGSLSSTRRILRRNALCQGTRRCKHLQYTNNPPCNDRNFIPRVWD